MIQAPRKPSINKTELKTRAVTALKDMLHWKGKVYETKERRPPRTIHWREEILPEWSAMVVEFGERSVSVSVPDLRNNPDFRLARLKQFVSDYNNRNPRPENPLRLIHTGNVLTLIEALPGEEISPVTSYPAREESDVGKFDDAGEEVKQKTSGTNKRPPNRNASTVVLEALAARRPAAQQETAR